jgi:protein-S-isoprenylcysteine O-methyltransferase Ste14
VPRQIVDLGDAACWGAVVLTWIICGLYNIKHAPHERSRNLRGQAALIGVAAVCAVVALLLRPYWQDLTTGVLWVQVPGLIVLVSSTVFTVWARLSLGTMWNFGPMLRDGHQLRTSGAYAVTRHPIYTGLIGMLLGTTLLNSFGRWIVILPAGLILLTFKAHQEERLLLTAFPGEYEQYRRRVPQLVPGLLALRRDHSVSGHPQT